MRLICIHVAVWNMVILIQNVFFSSPLTTLLDQLKKASRSTLYYLIFQRRLIAFLIKDSSLNSSTMVLLALWIDYNTHPTSRPRGWILNNSWSYICLAAGHGPRTSVIFTLNVNDIPSYVSSKTRLFADDGLLYREINSSSDATTLQSDLDALCRWESEWEMKFNSDKCFVMNAYDHQEESCHPPV